MILREGCAGFNLIYLRPYVTAEIRQIHLKREDWIDLNWNLSLDRVNDKLNSAGFALILVSLFPNNTYL